VRSTMPPLPGWFRGRDALTAFIRTKIGAPGVQRVLRASGADDAMAFYYWSETQKQYVAHALQVVVIDAGLVTEIHVFLDASLFPRFGLPPIQR
jgi:RNA polymerase sigma-70 factor, ECF subfamily